MKERLTAVSKPILVVRLPREMHASASGIERSLNDKMGSDYFVIVLFEPIERFEIQVFYEKDHKPIDLKGIEDLIKQKRK